jgi:adenosine deaminase
MERSSVAAAPPAGPRDPRTLPKAHLHLHLEGSARRETIHELADRYGQPRVAVDAFTGFGEFVARYEQAVALIRTPDDLARVCREVIEDDAAAGAVYSQPSVAPYFYGERFGMAVEAVLELMLDAVRDGAAAHGTTAELMLGAIRTDGPEAAERIARLAARYADQGVRAFGLAGDETHGEHRDFRAAFDIAREAGLRCVPHAGELVGPDSVRGALTALAPHRIAHGVTAVGDPALVDLLAETGVVLDVCPTSNRRLGVHPAPDRRGGRGDGGGGGDRDGGGGHGDGRDDGDGYGDGGGGRGDGRDDGDRGDGYGGRGDGCDDDGDRSAPLVALLRAGVRVTLNADDSLLFGASLADEYALARTRYRLGDDALATIAATSLRHSGAPAAVVEAGLAAITRWLAPEPVTGRR